MRTWQVVAALIFVLGGLLVSGAAQPQVANHFGYALPGPDGLPSRLSYAGRDYLNGSTCAGAGWCRANGPPACTSSEWLRGYRHWPLQPVGTVFTLFGASHPMFRAPTPPGMTTMALYVPRGKDCFLAYSLSGGP